MPSQDQAELRGSDERTRLRSFMESGGEVVGQVAGAAVGIVAGPLVGQGTGVVLGNVFSRVGRELYDRLLAPRQAARAAGALDVAVVRVEEHLRRGDTPRGDGFFDAGPDGRADADEVLEGTLLTAASSYEERKVPFIGRLYANLAFEPDVSPAHANFLLRLADRLTYRQLGLLAFFNEAQSGEYEMAVLRIPSDVSVIGLLPDEGLIAEMNDLSDLRLLGLRQNNGTVISPQATWGDGGGGGWRPTNIGQAALMPVGATLHRLMELNLLPRADLASILAALRGEPTSGR